jgi:hypothetical protein
MATYFGGRFKGNMNDYHIKNVQNEWTLMVTWVLYMLQFPSF